jgi:hypothetical protein
MLPSDDDGQVQLVELDQTGCLSAELEQTTPEAGR